MCRWWSERKRAEFTRQTSEKRSCFARLDSFSCKTSPPLCCATRREQAVITTGCSPTRAIRWACCGRRERWRAATRGRREEAGHLSRSHLTGGFISIIKGRFQARAAPFCEWIGDGSCRGCGQGAGSSLSCISRNARVSWRCNRFRQRAGRRGWILALFRSWRRMNVVPRMRIDC